MSDTIEKFIAELNNKDALTRDKAIQKIAKLAQFHILKLKDPDHLVRGVAVMALGKIGKTSIATVDIVEALIHGLTDENDDVRHCALMALGEMREKALAAVPELEKVFHKSNYWLPLCHTILALCKIGNPGVYAVLQTIYCYNKEIINYAFIEAFWSFGLEVREIGENSIKLAIDIIHNADKLEYNSDGLKQSLAESLLRTATVPKKTIPVLSKMIISGSETEKQIAWAMLEGYIEKREELDEEEIAVFMKIWQSGAKEDKWTIGKILHSYRKYPPFSSKPRKDEKINLLQNFFDN